MTIRPTHTALCHLQSFEQLGRRNLKRIRYPLDVVDRHVLLPALQHTYVGSVHTRALGQLLLG